MADLSTHINALNAKLQLLLKQHHALKKQNEQQKLYIAQLQEIDELQQQQIESLQQERLILKASISDMDATEKKQLEQKINGYIKNIDTCIALLSHNKTP